MKNRNVLIVNDCRDENARIRQILRAKSCFPDADVQFVGVSNTLEAGGLILDAVDTASNRPLIVLVNVAPRNGEARKWGNGVPFGRLCIEQTLIVGTVDGFIFSLLQKALGKKLVVEYYSVEDCVPYFGVSTQEQQKIITTQFRSLEFLPLLARQLSKVNNLPINGVVQPATVESAVWWVDNFGNSKTTILPEDIDFCPGETVCLFVKDEAVSYLARHYFVSCYKQLKDVPDNKVGIIIGSSGLGDKRFLEIVLQGGSAAQFFGIKSGVTLYVER